MAEKVLVTSALPVMSRGDEKKGEARPGVRAEVRMRAAETITALTIMKKRS